MNEASSRSDSTLGMFLLFYMPENYGRDPWVVQRIRGLDEEQVRPTGYRHG